MPKIFAAFSRLPFVLANEHAVIQIDIADLLSDMVIFLPVSPDSKM